MGYMIVMRLKTVDMVHGWMMIDAFIVSYRLVGILAWRTLGMMHCIDNVAVTSLVMRNLIDEMIWK